MNNNNKFIKILAHFNELPIITSLHEHNSYYITSDSTYRYGDALLDLANLDISGISQKITRETSCREMLLKLRKQQCKSLYFKLCRRSIIEYCESLFSNNNIDLDKLDYSSLRNLIEEMFLNLTKLQRDTINLYSILKTNSKQYRGIVYKEAFDKSNLCFDYIFINPPQYSVKFEDGKIVFETKINSVNDFFYYELINFLKNPFKVIQCHECQKYTKTKKYNTLYCSKSCSDKHTIIRLNRNPFYSKYLNRIKYLSLLLNNGKIDHTEYNLAQQKCRKLFDEYRTQPITEDNLKVFQSYLKKCK